MVNEDRSELALLKKQMSDYTASVNAKLGGLEADMEALLAENRRLIDLRESAQVELDLCVALIGRLASKAGLGAGAAGGDTVVVQLPSGQVSWQLSPSQLHALEELPRYPGPVEELEIQEKYKRVMKPGFP
jgi:hypothetical protein